MTFLLDTNVVSELRRRVPNAGVVRWIGGVRSEDLFISVLTVGEIRQGIETLRPRDPVAAESLDRWHAGLVTAYGDHIVDIDLTIAERWGRLNAPDRLPAIDGLLAATALVRGWILVTRNIADVARTGVNLLNPFD